MGAQLRQTRMSPATSRLRTHPSLLSIRQQGQGFVAVTKITLGFKQCQFLLPSCCVPNTGQKGGSYLFILGLRWPVASLWDTARRYGRRKAFWEVSCGPWNTPAILNMIHRFKIVPQDHLSLLQPSWMMAFPVSLCIPTLPLRIGKTYPESLCWKYVTL